MSRQDETWIRACCFLGVLVVVTPDVHRVHHSALPHESNRNYGFNLIWWDYLFGTYLDQPQDGHDPMQLGIDGYRTERQTGRLPGMLTMPFSAPQADSAETPQQSDTQMSSMSQNQYR